MSHVLTIVRVIKGCPCADGLKLFRDTFGEQVTVTEEICVKHAADFDWDWAAGSLLDAKALREFERLDKDLYQVSRAERNSVDRLFPRQHPITGDGYEQAMSAKAMIRTRRQNGTAKLFARLFNETGDRKIQNAVNRKAKRDAELQATSDNLKKSLDILMNMP